MFAKKIRNVSVMLTLSCITSVGFADTSTDIVGRWTTGFQSDSSGYVQFRETWRFAAETAVFDIDILINHPLGKSSMRHTYEGTYTLGGPAISVEGARDIDIVFLRTLRSGLDVETIQEWNSAGECGYSDWVIGIAKDVTGRKCDDEVQNVGTIYNIVKVVPETSLRFGDFPEDDPINDDPEARPTTLSLDTVYTRTGQGGSSGNGDDDEDLISGFYAVNKFEHNPNSCEASGLASSPAGFSAIEIFANSSVVPLMPGWSIQTCNSKDHCVEKVNRIEFGGDFLIHDKKIDASDHYQGESKRSNWVGECRITLTTTTTTRDSSGQLIMTSEVRRGVLEGVEQSSDCKTEDNRIDQQRDSWTCFSSKRLTITPIE